MPATIKTLLLSLTTILLIVTSSCNNHDVALKEKYLIDSSQLALRDSSRQFWRSKMMDSVMTSWKLQLEDPTKIKPEFYSQIASEVVKTEGYYKVLLEERNQMLREAKRKALASEKDEQPDVVLLIAIILVTGIIGGIAGPRFSLLTDEAVVDTAINNARSQVQAASQARDQLVQAGTQNAAAFAGVQLSLAESVKQLTESEQELKELEKEKERRKIYPLFGIIAALLSFVFLDTFSSKTLEFAKTIDYFIFAAYCTLAAVFAKKWILRIYELMSKKTP